MHSKLTDYVWWFPWRKWALHTRNTGDTDIWICGGTVVSVVVLILGLVAYLGFKDALMASLTPRLYILEYVNRLF